MFATYNIEIFQFSLHAINNITSNGFYDMKIFQLIIEKDILKRVIDILDLKNLGIYEISLCFNIIGKIAIAGFIHVLLYMFFKKNIEIN